MADDERTLWNRDMRLAVGCGCGDSDAHGVDHRYAWEGGCRPYSPPPPPRKPNGFVCEFRRLTFKRYRVADHGFRLTRNRYRGDPGFPSAWIGLALVVGAHSYGVTWADPKVVFARDLAALRDGGTE